MSALARLAIRRAAPAGAAAAFLVLCGCLTEPPLEDAWTKVEIVSVTPSTADGLAFDSTSTITVRARITYREIVTGSVIAELRSVSLAELGDAPLESMNPRLESAQRIDRILSNSVALGTGVRLVTGFDHLIQDVVLIFETGGAPADSAAPDSLDPGGTPGADDALIIVAYMGDAEEEEMENGEEVLVIDPFLTTERRILSAGFDLRRAP
ncbi:MAG: hypothetical protein ACKVU1_06100 [bacterium]